MSSHVKKIVINIAALYGKIIVNTLVAFITTRITLQILGDVDFGLFSLIGGVVAMLSFLNGALLLSTQRFLSIAIGKGNDQEIQQIFNSGVMLHLLMALTLIILFLSIQPLLFNGFLNIPEDRIDIVIKTYHIIIITTMITFFTIPYNAVINAREEMWFFAITDILMSTMKLGAAIIIMFIDDSDNLLVIYTGGIMLSALTILIIKMIWCKNRYPECHISKALLWNKRQIKMQLSFTGWNSFVTFAVICRDQGISIVMNIFFGPLINAAYGIVNQINALVSNFSTSLSTVFTPQIMQSYGAGDQEKMLKIAIFSSKITLLLSAIMGFPFLLESQTILNIWLNKAPEYTSIFCKLTIVLFIILQTYPGLLRALYAQGDIKWYQILVSSALILPVIIGYFLFKTGNYPVETILYLMIIGQTFTLLITVYFGKIKIGLNALNFCISSIFKPTLIFIGTYALLSTINELINSSIVRLIIVCLCSTLLLTLQFYLFVLSKEEKKQIKPIFNKIFKRK